MTTVICESFDADNSGTLSQEVTFTRTVRLQRVRPYLTFFNEPDTLSLTLKLYNENDDLITSVTQTKAQMKTAADNDEFSSSLDGTWTHNFVSFIFDQSIRLSPGEYKFELVRNDSFTESNTVFCAWNRKYEDTFVEYYEDPHSFTNDVNQPFVMEVYSYEVIKDY